MSRRQGRPLILVTNDDGIQSGELERLALALEALGEVIVSAPATEQSAVSHALTLKSPLRIERARGDRAWYSVSGTPADSVLLALSVLCPRPPDLVVSGINAGLNLGTDVFYSGTVAAAFEGAIRGHQAIAVSQELPETPEDGDRALGELFERTARFARSLGARLLESPLPPRTILSVNAPARPTESWVMTRMGRRVYREQIARRVDPRNRPYYWIGGPAERGGNARGTDADAVERGLISVTHLGLDLTSVQPLPGDFLPLAMGSFARAAEPAEAP